MEIWGFPGSGGGRPLATIALVKPIAYALQFRGVAAVDASGLVSARATAPGGSLRTFVESDGVRGGYEPDAGDEAVLQARIALGHDGSFTAVGSITFGVRHVMRFRTLGNGRLARTPDRHLRQGGAVARIEGGSGQFEGATGRITSNFLLSDTGEITDHQVGLVFVPGDSGQQARASKVAFAQPGGRSRG